MKAFLYSATHRKFFEQLTAPGGSTKDLAWKLFGGVTLGPDGRLRTDPLDLQLIGGYGTFYDKAFKAAVPADAKKFPFIYGKTSYIIWTWKGEYLFWGDGGEGATYEQAGTHPDLNGFWWAVPFDPNLPKMSESVTDGGKLVASTSPQSAQVWNGSYYPPEQDRKVSDLTLSVTVTFPNSTMYSDFINTYSHSPLVTPGPQGTRTVTISYK